MCDDYSTKRRNRLEGLVSEVSLIFIILKGNADAMALSWAAVKIPGGRAEVAPKNTTVCNFHKYLLLSSFAGGSENTHGSGIRSCSIKRDVSVRLICLNTQNLK